MKDAGMSYTVRTATTGSGASVQGYPCGTKSVRTSVSLQSSCHENGGIRSPAMKNWLTLKKPQYKGKKIR